MRLYSVYYISVGSSARLSSGARTTVITASGTGQPGLLPSALAVELELMMAVNTRNMYSCLQKYNKMNAVASYWTIIKFKSSILIK